MTYQHTLQYLDQSAPSPDLSLSADALLAHAGRIERRTVFLFVSHDKQGRATARYLRRIFKQAGVGCLHVCREEDVAPRERYVLDDAPIPPTLLCAAAAPIHAMEASLRRSHPSYKSGQTAIYFDTSLRRAAVLLGCPEKDELRVLILEGEQAARDERAFSRLLSRPIRITPVSACDEQQRFALSTLAAKADVLTHALGGEAYRRLSDACARHELRLTVLPHSHFDRADVTPGGQTLRYDTLSDVRITPGTSLAARAAVLAVAVARRTAEALGVPLSDECVRRGLSETHVCALCELVSIAPSVLLDRVDTPAEAALAFADLSESAAALPRPRYLLLDDALAAEAGRLPRELFDDALSLEQLDALPDPEAAFVLVGSQDFLLKARALVSERAKNAKK